MHVVNWDRAQHCIKVHLILNIYNVRYLLIYSVNNYDCEDTRYPFLLNIYKVSLYMYLYICVAKVFISVIAGDNISVIQYLVPL